MPVLLQAQARWPRTHVMQLLCVKLLQNTPRVIIAGARLDEELSFPGCATFALRFRIGPRFTWRAVRF